MYKQLSKKIALFLVALLFLTPFITAGATAQAASNAAQAAVVSDAISITTNLEDQLVTKADKLTFDLWARDDAGKKISTEHIQVTNNSNTVKVNWDDLEKTSYTLLLDVGINNVVIQVEQNGNIISESFILTREAAQDGDVIGTFTFSLEAFTVGLGYIIEPIQADIIKGRNAAQELDSILSEHGFTYTYTGSLESSFYLAAIKDGSNKVYKSTPVIPQVLKEKLEGNYDESSYGDAYGLGEFDFNYMSGWMYSVNNSFPNVGFSDKYIQDGDVMRVQYTLAYGMDIGGADAMGGGNGDFFGKVNRDELTEKIADINSMPNKENYLSQNGRRAAYNNAIDVLQTIDATQDEVEAALSEITAVE